MADPKGDKLYVNLSASQVRRRLKGFGHGVRKVHSAGRNRAVIIHTAMGRNLTELQTKFSDVGYAIRERDLSEAKENFTGKSQDVILEIRKNSEEEDQRLPDRP